MTNTEFFGPLQAKWQDQIERFSEMTSSLSDEAFCQRPENGDWSLGEVTVHMNLSIDPYMQAMSAAILRAQPATGSAVKLSFLGRKITYHAGPDGNVPAPKTLHPQATGHGRADMDRWLKNAQEFLKLMDRAEAVDLSGTRFRNPLVKFLSLNLADGFSIMVSHQERHVRQMEERLAKIRS
jgi:hypothetical protein